MFTSYSIGIMFFFQRPTVHHVWIPGSFFAKKNFFTKFVATLPPTSRNHCVSDTCRWWQQGGRWQQKQKKIKSYRSKTQGAELRDVILLCFPYRGYKVITSPCVFFVIYLPNQKICREATKVSEANCAGRTHRRRWALTSSSAPALWAVSAICRCVAL